MKSCCTLGHGPESAGGPARRVSCRAGGWLQIFCATVQAPALLLTRIFHVSAGSCHPVNGRAALPRRPESGRSSSFALSSYEMPRLRVICLIAALFPLAAAGQISFRAFDSYENLIEGGTVHTLVVDAGPQHLVTSVPRSYSATVENGTQSVLFKENTGSMSITMRVTTNSPGVLPDDDTLRGLALAINPDENFCNCPPAPPDTSPRALWTPSAAWTRSAASGRAMSLSPARRESSSSCSPPRDDAFDKGRVAFNLFLSSFRVEMIKERQAKPSPVP